MFHKIKEVHPLDNFILDVTFEDGKHSHYDVKPLVMKYPMFADLKDNSILFKQANIDAGGYGIVWNDELDISAEEVYENGTPIAKTI